MPKYRGEKTMKQLKVLILILLVGACSPESPKREPPPLQHDTVDINAITETAEVNSKVDILFVVDNSLSMDDDQANLSREVDKFVRAFSENSLIDFHVGVTVT